MKVLRSYKERIMKKLFTQVAKFAYFFSAMWISLSCFAQAYIDPSATTYLIQAIGAVVIAAGAVLTVFRHKIVAFFKKGSSDAAKREIHVINEDEDEKESVTEEVKSEE